MRRRDFLGIVGGAAVSLPLVALAQQLAKIPIIGFFGASTASAWEYFVAAFEQRLGELGWIEGLTVAIEQRCADGRNDCYAKNRSRVCSAEGRRHCHVGQRSPAGEAGNLNDTDRVRRDGGPAWRRTGSLKRPLAHTRKIASDPKAAHFAVSGDRRTP